MCSLIHDRYVRRVSLRSGIFSALFCSTKVLIVGTPVLCCGLASSASRRCLAAFHAAALVGNSCLEPMTRDFRLPLIHSRNRHLLMCLSNTTLPVLNRARFKM